MLESCSPATTIAAASSMPQSPDTPPAGRPELAARGLAVQPAVGAPQAELAGRAAAQAAGEHPLQRSPAGPTRSCSLCGTSITPLWRQYDSKSTCNACYIYAKRKGGAARPPALISSAAGPKHARAAAAQPPSAKPRRSPPAAKAPRRAPTPKPAFRAAGLLLVRRDEPRGENDALAAGELVLLRTGHQRTRAQESLWMALRLGQARREGGQELVAAHALLALAKGDAPLLQPAPRVVS